MAGGELGDAGAPAPQVIIALPRPNPSGGVPPGPPTAGRNMETPTFVVPPPAPTGLTSTLARPAASVLASTKLPPSYPKDAPLATSYRTVQPASGALSERRNTVVVSTWGRPGSAATEGGNRNCASTQ